MAPDVAGSKPVVHPLVIVSNPSLDTSFDVSLESSVVFCYALQTRFSLVFVILK